MANTNAKRDDNFVPGLLGEKDDGSGTAPWPIDAATGRVKVTATVTGQDTFSTIAVSGQDDIVAEQADDTLTLAAGDNITITTNAATDTVTISSTGGAAADIGAGLAIFESDTSVSVGNGRSALTIPAIFNTYVLTAALASVHTKGITGTTDIQIRRRRAGSDVDMLSTKITIGDEFFAADGVVDTSNDDVATGDQIYFDVDAVHSGTAPLGLSVVLTLTAV